MRLPVVVAAGEEVKLGGKKNFSHGVLTGWSRCEGKAEAKVGRYANTLPGT